MERRHRTDQVRFELRFRLSPDAVWPLEEVNALLSEHIAEENRRRHPLAGDVTREEAYRASIAEHGIRRIPEDLSDAIYRQEWRVLRMDRTIAWGDVWEVRDAPEALLGERVLCAKSADGRMVVTDAGGRRYFARPFTPLPAVERWRGLADEVGDAIDKEAAALALAPIHPSGDSRVVHLAGLSRGEEAQVGGALAPRRREFYATKDQAKRALAEILGAPLAVLPESVLADIDAAIDRAGLAVERIEEIARILAENA